MAGHGGHGRLAGDVSARVALGISLVSGLAGRARRPKLPPGVMRAAQVATLAPRMESEPNRSVGSGAAQGAPPRIGSNLGQGVGGESRSPLIVPLSS